MAVTQAQHGLTTERHDISLRDVRDGKLVVTYNHMVSNTSYTGGRHVSARLPVECLCLFDGGTLDVSDLSATEREWLQAASAECGANEIDFEGFQR